MAKNKTKTEQTNKPGLGQNRHSTTAMSFRNGPVTRWTYNKKKIIYKMLLWLKICNREYKKTAAPSSGGGK